MCKHFENIYQPICSSLQMLSVLNSYFIHYFLHNYIGSHNLMTGGSEISLEYINEFSNNKILKALHSLRLQGCQRVKIYECRGPRIPRRAWSSARSLLGQLLLNAFLYMWQLRSLLHCNIPNSVLDSDFDEMIAVYSYYSCSFLLQSKQLIQQQSKNIIRFLKLFACT